VNGRLIARRLLADGDSLTFGSARCRMGGIVAEDVSDAEPPKSAAPELTRRELDVIASLCRPAMSDDAFVTPATAREIAADLVVTEAAVKQHLLRLYSKLRIPEGQNRRIRLANEVVSLGLAKPQMPDDQRPTQAPSWPASPSSASPGSASPGSASPGSASPGSASPGSASPGPGAPAAPAISAAPSAAPAPVASASQPGQPGQPVQPEGTAAAAASLTRQSAVAQPARRRVTGRTAGPGRAGSA
jgi:hypothetical protein